MAKRLSKDELITTLNELGYRHLATSKDRFECNQIADSSTSAFRMTLDVRVKNVKIFRKRVMDFLSKVQREQMAKDNSDVFDKAVSLVNKLSSDEEKATMAVQKELYDSEQNIYNSHSYLEFPLDKKINAFYDDFSAVFLYFDDISTLGNNRCALIRAYEGDKDGLQFFAENHLQPSERKEFLELSTDKQRCEFVEARYGKDKVDIFESLETEAEKIEFVKNNIEFTHCALGDVESPNWGIGVYGQLDKRFSDFTSEQCVLPHKFCDFNNITLADTFEIKNNDLMQAVQAKIDIDKENLEIVDEKFVRGDTYRIFKTPKSINLNGRTYNYYIRYVCPSTGRVYHDLINEMELQGDKFYKKNDPTSFIHAWWHINNGGDDPTLENVPVIRC